MTISRNTYITAITARNNPALRAASSAVTQNLQGNYPAEPLLFKIEASHIGYNAP